MGGVAALLALRKLAAGVPWQTWVACGLLLAALLAVVYARHSGYTAGGADATTAIERANDAAKDRANKGEITVDECYATGGTWDRARGLCDNAAGK